MTPGGRDATCFESEVADHEPAKFAEKALPERGLRVCSGAMDIACSPVGFRLVHAGFLAALTAFGVFGCAAEPERAVTLFRPDTVSGSKDGNVASLPDQGDGPNDQEIVSLDIAKGDVGQPIAEGEFGWPCESNDDCDSDWCVEGATAGGVCSQTCFSTCPDGWVCRPVSATGADVAYICVFRTARLCWPCRADNDCRSATTDPDARCVDHGDAGRFCGVSCVDDGSCPEGFRCDEAGDGARQCVPAGQVPEEYGECGCNERAMTLSLETECGVTNEFGRCAGERGCGTAGLSACTARSPELERCNGVDDDCDGTTDGPTSSDCVRYYPDEDGDLWGIGVGQCLCESPGDGYATGTGDCSDVDANVSPGATERCNFIDDDCDLTVDEDNALGCTRYYQDVDEDGFGDVLSEVCRCESPGFGWITVGGDCDDALPTFNPAVQEKCDGVDNDCDGKTDEDNAKGCTVYYVDSDGDGYGKNSELRCACDSNAEYVTDRGGDCNDANTDIRPLAPEVCNLIDDNCDGTVDEPGTIGCGLFFRDADQDGYGVTTDAKCLCTATYPYTSLAGGDCNDNNTAVNPDGNEVCDKIDNDCDGQVDGNTAADCTYFYVDADQDGFGNQNTQNCLCEPKAPWNTLNGGDCNDTNPIAFPGAQEICVPGDENCNGIVNENGALGCANFYKDEDKDGFGTGEFQCLCKPEFPFNSLQTGDCYDQNDIARPGQANWFNQHRGDGSYDYNCDGNQERESAIAGGNCSDDLLGFCSATQKGFKGGIPSCGVYGDYLNDCDSGFFDCDDVTISIQQRCR